MNINSQCLVAEKLLLANPDPGDMVDALSEAFRGIEWREGDPSFRSTWWWNGWIITVTIVQRLPIFPGEEEREVRVEASTYADAHKDDGGKHDEG